MLWWARQKSSWSQTHHCREFGGGCGLLVCPFALRKRTPLEGWSAGFSSESTRIRYTCRSPVSSKAAALRSNRFNCVDDLPLAAAPNHTALSTSTTTREQCLRRARSIQRSRSRKTSPSRPLMWASCLRGTQSTSVKSSTLTSRW